MKKLQFLLLAALMFAACASKYEHVLLPAGADITDAESQWLWGYVNEAGEMMIEPQFEDAAPFSCGYAVVTVDGILCYVDTIGALHYLPDTLQWIDDFHNGFAHVGKEGHDGNVYYGVIDTTFQYVVEPTQDNIEGYEYETPYRDDRYLMNVEEWYLTFDFDEAQQATTFSWHTPNGKVVYKWRWMN